MKKNKEKAGRKKANGLTRRDFIASSAGLLGSIGLFNIISSTGCSKRWKDMNILFVSLDTLRADSCGFMGYGRKTTPFLDQLSRQGVTFDRMHTHSPWTDQSHASIFSSLYPHVHSITFHFKNYLRFSMASILKKYDYKTAAFVESVSLDKRIGIATGFDEYYNQSNPGNVNENRAEYNNKRVFEWIRKNHTRKFFLFVHYFDIHYPYDPLEPYKHAFHKGDYDGRVYKIGRGLQFVDPTPSTEQISQVKALYDGEIAYTDNQLSRLVNTLEQYKLLDNTLIVVFSDHGEAFGEHRLFGHGNSLYQELLHVPVVIKFPGSEYAGTRIKHVTRTIDILPTVLDYIDAGTEEALQGISLMPMIKGGDAKDLIFFSDGIRYASCLRQGDWKLINNYIMNDEVIKMTGVRKPEYELYNLKTDPGETINVSDKNPEKVEEIKELIKRYWTINKRWKKGFVMGNKKAIDKDITEGLRQLGYIQ